MNWSRSLPLLVVSLGCLAWAAWPVAAQKEPTPHGQDRPPGPALTPAEAIKKMKVPEGFTVELVAAEPDIVNPVAMTFDERGRIWITESLEYPRRSAGPGRDRVKVLESTKGDGSYDKVTVFAEGLNIPSGIAVGHGGVWVANAPDILFYKEGPDGKAAGKPEVVVTGFGRDDTHELPNSLTWGPDGWLYGLNGVFNRQPSSSTRARSSTSPAPCSASTPGRKRFQIFCRGHQQSLGRRLGHRGQRLRQRLRHRPSLAPHRDRLLPPPGRPLSALHLEARLHRQAPPSKGGLLRHPFLRQRRLSAGVPRAAVHGQHPRRLHQRRCLAARRLDLLRQAALRIS